MKIKLSQYTPRKIEGTIIIPKVNILTRKYLPEMYLNLDAINVMKNDTLPNIVLEQRCLSKEEELKMKTSCSHYRG